MTEHSGAFLLQGAGSLVAMEPAQFATENDFQILLARFPALLVGDQIDPQNPRRWVLVGREQPTSTGDNGASLWSIDHVFLDQDGIPTLVEIKRQSNSEIRRQVVGQMLDYAANFTTFWSAETLRAGLERTCQQNNRAVEDVLTELLGSSEAPNDFWQRVKKNLQTKTIRLLFVADVIPLELRRIVEFLNEQMDTVEVLAVELRQFAAQELKTIVPTVYGQTQKASSEPSVRWDEAAIFDKLKLTVGPKELEISRKIYEWMKKGGAQELIFGTGKANGSVCPAFRVNGVNIKPVLLSSDGGMWFQFGSLEGKPVFGSAEDRGELMNRFNAVGGVNFTDVDLNKFRRIPLSTIAADPDGEKKILGALTWMEGQIERANSAGTTTDGLVRSTNGLSRENL
jgi:hypothetical protein